MFTAPRDPHPGEHRLDIFYGGSFDTYFRRSIELCAEAAQSLADGARVLYLNVLSSEARLEDELRKVCRTRGGAETRRKVLALTLKADDLMNHAEFIEKLVASSHVRLIVLNSFEFAAMMPRRRMRVVGFLLNLRNFAGVDLAIGMRRKPLEEEGGSIGALAFQSTTMLPLGEITCFEVTEPIHVESEEEWHESFSAILYPRMQTESLKTNDLGTASDTPHEYARAA